MSDYAPTTEEVRDQYATAWWDDFSLTDLDDPAGLECIEHDAAKFDRWHAEEIRKAKAEAWESCAAVAEDILTDITGDIEPYEGQFSNPYRGGETND